MAATRALVRLGNGVGRPVSSLWNCYGCGLSGVVSRASNNVRCFASESDANATSAAAAPAPKEAPAQQPAAPAEELVYEHI